MKLLVGISLILLALAWGTSETAYFGWNFFPHSFQELVCAGIAVVIAMFGLLMLSEVAVAPPKNEPKKLDTFVLDHSHITIVMEGGLIQEIHDIPEGMTIDVLDYDVEGQDEDHPNMTKDLENKSVFHNIWTSGGQIK